MEEKDNVIPGKFREPTDLEEYIRCIQEDQPETLFTVMIVDDMMLFSHLGIDDVDSMIGKLLHGIDYLKMLRYGEVDE